jgi:hypothetical protein
MPRDTIRNPATGRMVKRTGKIGRRLVSTAARKRKPAPWYVAACGATRPSDGAVVRKTFRKRARTRSAAVIGLKRAVAKDGLEPAHIRVSKVRPVPKKRPPAPARDGRWADAAPGDKYLAVAKIGRGIYHGFGKTRGKAHADLVRYVPTSVEPPARDKVAYEKRPSDH